MSSPSHHPYGVRFVPELVKSTKLHIEFSLSYISSVWGIFTAIQMLCSLCTFLTCLWGKTHTYTVSELQVYMSPNPTIIFVIFTSFFFFYTDLLIILSSTLSNFDSKAMHLSLYYFFTTVSACLFNLSAAVAFFVKPDNDMDYILGGFCVLNCVLYTLRTFFNVIRIVRS